MDDMSVNPPHSVSGAHPPTKSDQLGTATQVEAAAKSEHDTDMVHEDEVEPIVTFKTWVVVSVSRIRVGRHSMR